MPRQAADSCQSQYSVTGCVGWWSVVVIESLSGFGGEAWLWRGGGYPALTSAMRSGTVATGSAMPRPEAGVVGPGHGVGRGGLFGRGYFSSARTLVVMLSTSSPYRWCRVGSAPASRNLSGSATGRTFLWTPARTAAEATVSNRPPITEWFSRVTASRSVFS